MNGKLICRKCLAYNGTLVNKEYIVKSGDYKLAYDLTKEQKRASEFILFNVINGKDCAINAVCGAGKTEIIYPVIKHCLNNDLKVGIAIPRRDVVIELASRIQKDFNVSVVSVYGGHKNKLEGDIILFTTHQAFRYIDYFDILIIDEVDAFPYNNNDVLKNIISKCSKNFVYLSATMPKYITNDRRINKFYLNRRYHGYDVPIPKCVESFAMIMTLKRYLKKYGNKVVFVYFPTIKIQNIVFKKIKCDYLINSKIDDREVMLNKIRVLQRGVVFTTTVLERGITVKDVQVIVYNADHRLFCKDSLIQISGRVGRNKLFSTGNIIFICKKRNKSIKQAIKILKKSNE